jgi:hypothetical protein
VDVLEDEGRMFLQKVDIHRQEYTKAENHRIYNFYSVLVMNEIKKEKFMHIRFVNFCYEAQVYVKG